MRVSYLRSPTTNTAIGINFLSSPSSFSFIFAYPLTRTPISPHPTPTLPYPTVLHPVHGLGCVFVRIFACLQLVLHVLQVHPERVNPPSRVLRPPGRFPRSILRQRGRRLLLRVVLPHARRRWKGPEGGRLGQVLQLGTPEFNQRHVLRLSPDIPDATIAPTPPPRTPPRPDPAD